MLQWLVIQNQSGRYTKDMLSMSLISILERLVAGAALRIGSFGAMFFVVSATLNDMQIFQGKEMK